jgi:hypothetical protein
MAFNLRNRSFLKEIDFTPRELRYPLKLSEALKLAKYAGTEVKHIEGTVGREIMKRTLALPTVWKSPARVFGSGASIVFDQAENPPANYQGGRRRLARITIVAAPQAMREIWSCLAPGHDRQREAGCPQVVLACSWGSSIRAEGGVRS